LNQSYKDAFLFIYDDGGSYTSTYFPNHQRWALMSGNRRCRHLPQKYHKMIGYWEGVLKQDPFDVIMTWDDDDIYLPHHIESMVLAMEGHHWSKPSLVWSTYTGTPEIEEADGRFHGALAVKRDYFEKLKGWPQTARADFDQRFIEALHSTPPGDPCKLNYPSYVFRWADTRAGHCQRLMTSPDNERWYGSVAYVTVPKRIKLQPMLDVPARQTVEEIRRLITPINQSV
jgi:hypothetical protein